MSDENLQKDIPDTEKDSRRLQPDKATLDLPDAEDIPGQKNMRVPNLKEMADTTIASDDEEGVGVLDNDNKAGTGNKRSGDYPDITNDSVSSDSDVTPDEKIMLEETAVNMDTTDNENLTRAKLDNIDFEGEELNEDIEVSGADLDIPGAELDDTNEEIGEEDEENNAYSFGDNE